MEPLSALSVAAAAVQFLDFGSRLISDARQIYCSSQGMSPEFVELSRVAQDLSTLATDIDKKLHAVGLSGVPVGPYDSGDKQGEPERALYRLCLECKEIEAELQGAIRNLQARGTTKLQLAVNSFVVSCRGLIFTKPIDGLMGRLHGTRSQLTIALLVVFWGTAQKSDKNTQEFHREQARTMQNLDSSVRNLEKSMRELVYGTSTLGLGDDTLKLESFILNSRSVPNGPNEAEPEWKMCLRISESLSFRALQDRESAISPAHAETFKWIFEKPREENGQALWSDFRKWMTGREAKIYWISGKAGAGKSTLVKFLVNDPRVQSDFAKWAGDHQILLATYYSWNAGTDLQKSQEGLLRSLLYQCVTKNPTVLVPLLFPSRWALVQLLKLDPVRAGAAWTTEELLTGVKKLIAHAGRELTDSEFRSYKLAFVIDGLDEFQGSHHRLLDILTKAGASPYVKICVSSRPWNVFHDALHQNPMLQLENITRQDIEAFVRQKLACSRGYQESAALYPEASKQLQHDICDKSQGVFLWVALVTAELLRNLQDGTRFSKLQAILNGLPSDLSLLFGVMWEGTDERYRGEAAQLFQVLQTYERYGIAPYALSVWMGTEDAALVSNLDLDAAASTIISSLRRILDSRTRGLLEICEDRHDIRRSRVDYMHRTVKEWAGEIQTMLMTTARSKVNPTLAFLKGEIAIMPVRYFCDYSGDHAGDSNGGSAAMYELSTYLEQLGRIFVDLDMKRGEVSTAGVGLEFFQNFEEISSCSTHNTGSNVHSVLKEHINRASAQPPKEHSCKAPREQSEDTADIAKLIRGPRSRFRSTRVVAAAEPNPPCEACTAPAGLPRVPVIIDIIFGGIRSSILCNGAENFNSSRLEWAHVGRFRLLQHDFVSLYSNAAEVKATLKLLMDPFQLRLMMGYERKDDVALGESDQAYVAKVIAELQNYLSEEEVAPALGRSLSLDAQASVRSCVGTNGEGFLGRLRLGVGRSGDVEEVVTVDKTGAPWMGLHTGVSRAQESDLDSKQGLLRLFCCFRK
ncbi:hypothetical protein QBC34DRAFT_417209 [Podospora aff. communis PSN243]|uniref:NACHT domain-containing protein n=1 Tax=Podospora aff. communis PSN243 TaxID=3040156 RepID=A0AAV9G5L6_9PEZI|nr:hypothetical protein QBC34DRAFT_417209 [Podospora aff. communis PSN243]